MLNAQASAASDRNLVFGMLALQMNFVDRDALIRAMHTWVLDKKRPLGDILLNDGLITPRQREVLDLLLEQHLLLHDNDPQKSLHALAGQTPLSPMPERVTVQDLEASLSMPATALLSAQSAGERTAEECRYRKLRLHATGGLGEVFVAKDTELERDIALKEIQDYRADDLASRKRFEQEAQITGQLEHPGVVPVYGLGVHASGRPYYAMRLIRGENLRTLIARFHSGKQTGSKNAAEKLTLRGLLRNFNDACNAVAYAHSRGVIHRDLKPENIMVGKFGETLVVDWGLAKSGLKQLVQGEDELAATVDPPLPPAAGMDLAATLAGTALGTPSYMSPEQARGEHTQCGPPTDIYSLGAILYVILSGEKPFPGKNKEEILPLVIKGEFASPSTVAPNTSPALSAICLKAMSLAPADRYQSALDLAADVEHWLADEPTSVYREPRTVRAWRWARRHRAGVSAAAMLLLSTAVASMAIAIVAWNGERATAAQKDIAEKNFGMAKESIFSGFTMMETMEASFAASPALQDARKQFMVNAASAFHTYLEQEPDNWQLIERAASVYRYTANIHRRSYENREAQALYDESIRLGQLLHDREPTTIKFQMQLSAIFRDKANYLLNVGEYSEALQLLNKSVGIAEAVLEGERSNPAFQRLLAWATMDLANLQIVLGQFEPAHQSAQKAAELFGLLAKGPPHTVQAYDRAFEAMSLHYAAVAQRELGQIQAAILLHKNAADILGLLAKSKNPDLVTDDVANLQALCRLEQSRTARLIEKYRDAAATNLKAAAGQWKQLSNRYPKIPSYKLLWATTLVELAPLCPKLDPPKTGEPEIVESWNALTIMKQQHPEIVEIDTEMAKALLFMTGRNPSTAAFQTAAKADKSKVYAAIKRHSEKIINKRLLPSLAQLVPENKQ